MFSQYGLAVEVIALPPEFKELTALKGRRSLRATLVVALTGFIRFVLAKIGLYDRSEAQIVPLSGGPAVRFAGVISGNLNVTLISSLQGRHDRNSASRQSQDRSNSSGVNITRKSFPNKDREVGKYYLHGFAESIRLLMVERCPFSRSCLRC